MRTLTFALICVSAASCAKTIAGTDIRDTEENRAILEVLGELRASMQERNAEKILARISTEYFENMGTIDQSDDFGYQKFATEILPKTLEATEEFYVDFEIHDVVVNGKKAHADIRFASRAKINMPAGASWDSQREFNRIELQKEEGRWLVIAGL